MSFVIKKNTKGNKDDPDDPDNQSEECKRPDKVYDKKCSSNKLLLQSENENRIDLGEHPADHPYLYPTLDDPNFNKKIAEKKEFSDTKYDGTIYDVEKYANILSNAEYELLPHQAFIRNFMSFQTPYNSLLLFHGLGSGKTCSAIGVCEEMRDYLRQMGINQQIIIVASPNVQDNFKLQLFDERKLKEVDGLWTMKGCLGNKLLKEINPTGMKGLKKEKIIQQARNLINSSYQFVGYLQFSNEIVRNADLDNPEVSQEIKIRNLQNIYRNSLVVIDEVHNIRIADDNENKNVAKNLTYLVSVVDNLRLLLLSATPMFNNYKEIIWLINLMNMNDRRGIIGVADIFDKDGNFKKDGDGKELGKEMLARKVTGYVSYVRGENPYTFPFRVYPDQFAPEHTFKMDTEYPKCQINGKKIPDDRKIKKLNLYLTAIGKYQELGYKYIVDRLRARQSVSKQTRTGKMRNMPSFNSLASFGYTDLMNPIEALNIVYPLLNDELEGLTEDIKDIECQDQEEEDVNDLSPVENMAETDVVEEIDNVLERGPQADRSLKATAALLHSELESEPAVTEGIEADPGLFDAVREIDTRKINSNKAKIQTKTGKDLTTKKTKGNIIFNELEEGEGREGEGEGDEENKPQVTSFSKSLISKENPKPNPKAKLTTKSNLHLIEGETVSNVASELNPVKTKAISGLTELKPASNKSRSLEDYSPLSDVSSISKDLKGSKGGKSPSAASPSRKLFINPKELTGTTGLKRIMNYTDSKTPSVKGAFEYQEGAPHMFKTDQIGLYSAKIKNICNSIYDESTGKVSEGIILIYSAYIDSGILPMALALEEMGFTRYGKKAKSLFKSPPTPLVDVETMEPPTNKKNFKPARYVMITGDPRLSPDNDADVKAITSDDNIFSMGPNGEKIDISGSKIKVVLISQAGSEGLDFKVIRQIHILEPWYNMNRNEQIIGRGVRNFSHKDLPFDKRNVQIFLYGTILRNAYEEAADLYVYRISEIKAVKIGRVTRLLKETSVDCIINHDQTQFTSDNFKLIPENRHVEQLLSNGIKIKDFEIGDAPNSATCDYMETCEYKCIPDLGEDQETILNYDTYNEAFMLINSDKIIQKIKMLMKIRFFYKKRELFQLINTPKKYPTVQIYAALTQIINDNTEYISDKYDRTGYLVNIGDYYLFQPSELNFKNISIFDRSTPLDYKHSMINFEIQGSIAKPVIDKRGINEIMENVDEDDENDFTSEKELLKTMYDNYVLALSTSSLDRGNKNWYEQCGIVIIKMKSEGIKLEVLESFLIEHIVDTLMMIDRVSLLNFIYANKEYAKTISDVRFRRFITKVSTYLRSKIISYKKIDAIVIYDGQSSIDNLHIYVLNGNKWLIAEPEDKRALSNIIDKKYKLKESDDKRLNQYVGFIGFENNRKYMVYKVKDTANERSTGYRCDQSGKEKVISVLGEIINDDELMERIQKDSLSELCVRQEFILRNLSRTDDSRIWFLDTVTAIYNEFEKREKSK
jgi:superfamily II DNA or RNA helicase